MRRYFFDIRDGELVSPDHVGQNFETYAEAYEKALSIAREIAAEPHDHGCWIEIRIDGSDHVDTLLINAILTG